MLIPGGGRFPSRRVTVRCRRFPPSLLLVRGDRSRDGRATALIARATFTRRVAGAAGCPRTAGYRVSGAGSLLLVRARCFLHAARQTRLVRLEVGRLAAARLVHRPRRRLLAGRLIRLARLARTFVQRGQQRFARRRVRPYLTASLREERERALLSVQLQRDEKRHDKSVIDIEETFLIRKLSLQVKKK